MVIVRNKFANTYLIDEESNHSIAGMNWNKNKDLAKQFKSEQEATECLTNWGLALFEDIEYIEL